MKKILKFLLQPEGWISRSIILLLIAVVGTLWFLGYLDNIIAYLDSKDVSFSVGTVKLTAYQVVKRAIGVMLLLWVANYFSSLGQDHIRRIHHIRASNKALIAKTFQIILYFIVFLIALNILNISLASLAVLGGAVGIGLGFGLQKIASNFISGLILLFEKSVEEGNLIEISGVTGFVKSTGARYTLIETHDGKEVMVPNEDFITGKVINWTYTNKRARAEIIVGVAYNSDIEKAQRLILDAAYDHPRCSRDPQPTCYLQEFAASSINFILYFWVDDVSDGRLEPRSDIMMSIWKKFKDNGIEIPFNQMDVHVKKD
jgi:small-conductance mechanosensitive channel